MAMHYDFNIMMAAKMTRLLNKTVQPSELTYGVPSAPSSPNGRNTVVRVTFGDEHRRIAYDRYDMSTALSRMPEDRKMLKLSEVVPADVLAKVNSKIGFNFKLSDFESIEPVSGFIEFKFAANHLAYTGTFSVPYFIPGASRVAFDHSWDLAYDTSSDGADRTALGGDWTFTTPVAGQGGYGLLGGGTSHVPFPAGITLPLTGDFIYDLEIIITANMAYLCTLSTNGAGNGSVASTLGSLYFAAGKAYLYGVTNAANAPAIPINVPQRYTIVGLDGNIYLYHRGMLIEQAPQPIAGTKFVGFRNVEGGVSQLGQSSYIRKLRALKRRPTADELFYVLNGETLAPIFPLPLHHFGSIAGDYKNRGTAGGNMNTSFPTGKHLNKPWFGGPTGGAVPLGLSIPVVGDFTIDVELSASDIGNEYGYLFTAGTGTLTGDLVTWRDLVGKKNVPTLQSMGYGSAADVPLTALSATTSIRHTITRKDSTLKWYEDGVLKWTFNNTSNFTWNVFRCSRPVSYFRNFRFWNLALSSVELNDLFTFKT